MRRRCVRRFCSLISSHLRFLKKSAVIARHWRTRCKIAALYGVGRRRALPVPSRSFATFMLA